MTTGHAFQRARNKVLRYLYEEGAIASTHAANRAAIAQASGLEPEDFQALWDLLLRAALVDTTGAGLTGSGWLTPAGFDEGGKLARKRKK
jgi:hypothetical protein